MNPLVKKVDHVFVPVADPAPLFELFTGPLGLPVAWADHDYGLFRSSSVCLGNADLWLEVDSLERAREALLELDLLGPTRASGAGLDDARTGGLDVWLAEPR